MRLVKDRWWIPTSGAVLAVLALAVAGTASGSCTGTSTRLCEQFDVRCREGQECAAAQPVCITAGGCGDNITGPGEECDDGNIMDGDGCSHDCRSREICGNQITDFNEDCDGEPNCSSDCHFRRCGNGIVDHPEEKCDDGGVDTEGCNADCTYVSCGDRHVNLAAHEECDTGGASAECSKFCRKPICGDLVTSAGEQCDTGTETQFCNADCTSPGCGDGRINVHFTPPGARATEECDNGKADTATCNGNNGDKNGPGTCRKPACGDGYTNRVVGEECDNLDGVDAPGCNGNGDGANPDGSCRRSRCGDGYVNHADGEDCDNRDGGDTAECNGNDGGKNSAGSCKTSRCGDHYINHEAGEACDDGQDTRDCNGNRHDVNSCQPSRCGDQYLNPADNREECESNSDCRTAGKPICHASQGDCSCKAS